AGGAAAGVKPAETRVAVVAAGDATEDAGDWALVRATLVTGRTHQIRVHLASIGHPIWGDPIYAPPPPRAPRLALHAARLSWPGGAAVSPATELIAMLSVDIRRITAAETRPLRQSVLRPHQTLAELVYGGDNPPDGAR